MQVHNDLSPSLPALRGRSLRDSLRPVGLADLLSCSVMHLHNRKKAIQKISINLFRCMIFAVRTEFSWLRSTVRLADLRARLPQLYQIGFRQAILLDHESLLAWPAFARYCREAGIQPLPAMSLPFFRRPEAGAPLPPVVLHLLARDEAGLRCLIALHNLYHRMVRRQKTRRSGTVSSYIKDALRVDLLRRYGPGLTILNGGYLSPRDTEYLSATGRRQWRRILATLGAGEIRSVNFSPSPEAGPSTGSALNEGVPLSLRLWQSARPEEEIGLGLWPLLDRIRRRGTTWHGCFLPPWFQPGDVGPPTKPPNKSTVLADGCPVIADYKQKARGTAAKGDGRIPNDDGAGRRVSRICRANLRSAGLTGLAYWRQLWQESRVLREAGAHPVLLFTAGLVDWMREQGIPWALRGSAVSSLTVFGLRISPVDPLRAGLDFFRFLTPGGGRQPDLDLDIAWDERSRVIREVSRRWSPRRVVRMGTVIRYRPRAALWDLGRALGCSDRQLSRLARGLRDDGVWTQPVFADEVEQRLRQLLPYVSGLARHYSRHTGGIILLNQGFHEKLPVVPAPGGLALSLWAPGETSLATAKIDILGSRALAALRDMESAVRDRKTPVPPLSDWPWRGSSMKDALELYAAGESVGCPQLESPGMREFLRCVPVTSQADITRVLALYRPGPLRAGMTRAFRDGFAAQKSVPVVFSSAGVPPGTGQRGPDPWTVLRTQCLPDTDGYLLYQEQVLCIARRLAGFDPTRADKLRRALSAGEEGPGASTCPSQGWRQQFVSGMMARGYDGRGAHEVFDYLVRFCGYSFNKAHATSYARLALLAGAWRCRQPAVFFAAIIQNRGGFYPTSAYVEEARRLGVTILPVCARESRWQTRAVSVTIGKSSGAEGNCQVPGIRPGLDFLTGARRSNLKGYLAWRDSLSGRLWLDDFLAGLPHWRPDKPTLEALVESGALDFTGVSRRAFWALRPVLLEYSRQPMDLWRGNPGPLGFADWFHQDWYQRDWPEAIRQYRAWRVTRLFAREHPLARWYAPPTRADAPQRTLVTGRRLRDDLAAEKNPGEDGPAFRVAGLVVARRRLTTAREGRDICLLCLSDPGGLYEVEVGGPLLRQNERLLTGQRLFELEVRLTGGRETGPARLVASRLWPRALWDDSDQSFRRGGRDEPNISAY